MRDARCDLGADGGQAFGHLEDERQRGLRLARVEHTAARRGAAGRVEEGPTDAREVGEPGVLVADDGVGPVPQVDRGDGGGRLVDVDGQHLTVQAGEGHRVPSDAAPEVGDPLDTGGGEPLRVPRGDLQTGGLLQTVRREEHARCERAELRPRLRAQPRLGERGGHQPGVQAVGPQPLTEPLGDGLVVVGERLEELPPLGGHQRREAVGVHLLIQPPTRTPHARRPRDGRALALGLTEC